MNADSAWDLTALKVDAGWSTTAAHAVPVRRPRRPGPIDRRSRDDGSRCRLKRPARCRLLEGGRRPRANWAKDKEWKPALDEKVARRNNRFWKKAVTRTFDWVEAEETCAGACLIGGPER